MFYTAHGAYSGSGSSCRNLERVVLVSESIVYQINRDLASRNKATNIGEMRVTSDSY